MPFLAAPLVGAVAGWAGKKLFGKKKKKAEDQGGLLAKEQTAETARRNELSSFLTPQYKALAEGPGYSPEEQSAITQESLGSVGNTFDAYRDRATNRVARTGNTAGYGSMLSEMAREEGRTKGGVTRQNMISFADEKQRRRFAGLQGLAQMFGVDTSFLSNVMGQNTSIFQQRLARKPTGMDKWKMGLGVGAGALQGIFGGGNE